MCLVKPMERTKVREVARCNDLVRMSFLCALLREAGVECLIADDHASAIQGSLDILPRRLMVASSKYLFAVNVLREAGEASSLSGHD
jgi:hypothetical protein